MFLLSILILIISSYLITSLVMSEKIKNNAGFIYFLLICFSQLILTFELLSLFSAISQRNFIIANTVVLIISIFIYKITKKTLYLPNIKSEIQLIKKALKTDKILYFISILFILCLCAHIIISVFAPVNYGDAVAYYLPRTTSWFQNGNLNHFVTQDVRELIMPVNMDLLYLWQVLYTKSFMGCAVFAFFGYINACYVLYNLLGELAFCKRRRLWTVYIFSGLSVISVMAHTPCADLFIGSLIITAIYLFVLFCKYNQKNYIYFSSLAYALAIGTKTTSLFTLAGVFFLFILIHRLYSKNNIYKSAFVYIILLGLNTIIFSSYNYILNYLHFGNFLSNETHILINHFRGGFKGFLCNLISYIFFVFDLSGIQINGYNEFIMELKDKIIYLVSGNGFNYLSPYYPDKYEFSSEMSAVYSALGVLGVLVFYPAMLISLLKLKYKNKKTVILASFTGLLVLNVIFLSAAMIFTKYNMRYVVTFIVISSPVIAYTYVKQSKNIYKWLILFFFCMYTYTYAEAISDFVFYIKNNGKSCSYSSEESIYNYFKNKDKSKIGLIISRKEGGTLPLDELKFLGHNVDKLLAENIRAYDLPNYNYIIVTTDDEQVSSLIAYKIFDVTKYASVCNYLDYNKEAITMYNGADLSKTVKVLCRIPNIYIKYMGFEQDKDIIVHDYIVYKRKN